MLARTCILSHFILTNVRVTGFPLVELCFCTTVNFQKEAHSEGGELDNENCIVYPRSVARRAYTCLNVVLTH